MGTEGHRAPVLTRVPGPSPSWSPQPIYVHQEARVALPTDAKPSSVERNRSRGLRATHALLPASPPASPGRSSGPSQPERIRTQPVPGLSRLLRQAHPGTLVPGPRNGPLGKGLATSPGRPHLHAAHLSTQHGRSTHGHPAVWFRATATKDCAEASKSRDFASRCTEGSFALHYDPLNV